MKVRELVTKLGYDIDENKLKRYDTTVTAIKTGMGVLTGIAGAVFGAAGWFVKGAADVEQLQVALETMTGSADKAKKLYGEFVAAAASTPFELNDYAVAGKKLLAFGEDADNIVPTLNRIGDVASGLSVPLGDLAEIYGKARVQGTLYAEDMMQFSGRGVPIAEALGKVLGIREDQVKEFGSKGKIKFADLQKAFQLMTSEGGRFFNGMIAQSKTFGGLMSNVFDMFSGLRTEIGMELLPAAKELAKAFLAWLTANKEIIKTNVIKVFSVVAAVAKVLWTVLSNVAETIITVIDVAKKLFPVIVTLTGAFAAYKGTLLAIQALEWIKYLWMMRDVILKAVKAQWTFNIAMTANPIGLIIAGIVALGIAIGFLVDDFMTFLDGGESAFGGVWTWVMKVWKVVSEFAASIRDFLMPTITAFLAPIRFLLDNAGKLAKVFGFGDGEIAVKKELSVKPSSVARQTGNVTQNNTNVSTTANITLPPGSTEQQKKTIEKHFNKLADERDKKTARIITNQTVPAEV